MVGLDYGCYSREIAREVGIVEAVVFQRLVEESNDDFFSIHKSAIAEDLHLSRREIDSVLKRLQEVGFIECDVLNNLYKIINNVNYPLQSDEDSKKSITNKRKNRYTSSAEYEVIKTVLEEGKTIFKKHRLDDEKPTVLIKRTIKFIEMLENGTFLDNIELADDFRISDESKLNRFKNPMLLPEIEILLVQALDGIRIRKGEQYYPTNKSVLENMSIDTFFYNPRTGYSWLIESIVNEPSMIISIRAEKAFKSLPSAFCDVFKKELQFDFLVESDKIKFSDAVVNFYWEYKDLANKYENIYKNTNWLNYYATESGFATQICYYIKHYHVTAPMSYVKTKDFWSRFVKWANDFHHVNLNPSFDFLMSLKKSYDNENAKKSDFEKRKKEIEEMKRQRELQADFENL